MDIHDLSAAALSEMIRSRRLSCCDVMIHFLDRIERLNGTLNAIVSLRDRQELLADADLADQDLRQGHWRGPLHGFPFAIKDLSEAAGLPCSYGSRIHAGFLPDYDDIHVARIRAAGAILIGKTNAPEMGLGSQTYNEVFGVTRNPWNTAFTVGGSSGGAAAALAARLVPLADGSDMMGSLRNPAAFTNIVGYRPSYGLVPSLSNELFLGTLAVNGPMGQSVADVEMLLAIQSGRDPRDPFSWSPQASAPDYLALPLRIGWLGDYNGYLPFEPGVLDLCRQSLETFRQLGMEVEDVAIGFDMDRLWRAWKVLRHALVAGGQANDYADPARRALMKPELVWEIENGQALSAADFYDASMTRSDWYRRMLELFERYDALILPTTQVFPFPAEWHWPEWIDGRSMDTYHRWMEVVIGPTMAGLPVAAMPAGFSADHRPTGIQIIGRPQGDRQLLALAKAYETASGWLDRKPAL
ncbi:amidase [Rhizobium alvei]|uniref:Amidase n=1 Tax=Rhizobium alvei TaxID=1132659 RepID=A0ABT8YI56_9HYPH|nr:amidase [Rhizobium alvei]MDO6963112.1 amidase [Rhizobium alvei]